MTVRKLVEQMAAYLVGYNDENYKNQKERSVYNLQVRCKKGLQIECDLLHLTRLGLDRKSLSSPKFDFSLVTNQRNCKL